MSTSLTLQPFADLIRHGKHARAAQSADPSPADRHANVRDQRLHDQQPVDRRQAERGVEREREEHERERERHDHARDKAQAKEMAEAIVKEENAAREKMPYIKGLERFKILAKMGEYVSSPRPRSYSPHCIASTAVHFHTYTRPSILKPTKKSPVSRLLLRHIPYLSIINPPSPIVKVVRKYELSASQVGLLHHCLLPTLLVSGILFSLFFSSFFPHFPSPFVARWWIRCSPSPFPHATCIGMHWFPRCRKGISISTLS